MDLIHRQDQQICDILQLRQQICYLTAAQLIATMIGQIRQISAARTFQLLDNNQWGVRFLNPMILELKRGCMQTVERMRVKLKTIRETWYPSMPKSAQQTFNSVNNDIQLLKDNFTLISTKVFRLQAKCDQKQYYAKEVQKRVRVQYEHICEAYKSLQVKHQRMGKELNFIKFSNKNLRKELSLQQRSHAEVQMLRSIMGEIQQFILANAENLSDRVRMIVDGAAIAPKSKAGGNEFEQLNCIPIQESSHFNHRKIGSCDLGEPKSGSRQATIQKTKKKKGKEAQKMKQGILTDRKRSQLAKLVEQQGRMTKIHECYMSTNLV